MTLRLFVFGPSVAGIDLGGITRVRRLHRGHDAELKSDFRVHTHVFEIVSECFVIYTAIAVVVDVEVVGEPSASGALRDFALHFEAGW